MQTTTATPTPELTNIKQTKTLQQTNLERVQALVAEFQAGRPEGYLAGVADDIKGSVLEGLIPGGDFKDKNGFVSIMQTMPEYMDVKKFEPKNWRAVDNDVLFRVDWQFVWLPTGKLIETTAMVRKVVRDGLICEKYHMVDCEQITGEKSPVDTSAVERVQQLLGEFMSGNPAGYLEGVADDIKASMFNGLIPGADGVASKADFAAVNEVMPTLMDVKKFEPVNYRALPNNDVMFEVNWQFVWLPTGKLVETTAVVRKVVNKDNKICEKYHLLDVEDVVKESPREVIG